MLPRLFKDLLQCSSLYAQLLSPQTTNLPITIHQLLPNSIQNTPSKLSHFLKYAESNLGVRDATAYEEPFQTQSYGPDILHLVDDKSLLDMGLA
ncbi:hypothetical protein FPV67DRAFT_1407298 [Lyophyllum atratum]|nr:hypothetical protein FPV67DRAFT_1407298 [Lyophyllum atratum]